MNISNGRCFAGWGNLVFFDTEEHQISHNRKALAKITNLGTQWKIIHDFKPTEYLEQTLSLYVAEEYSRRLLVCLEFQFPMIELEHTILDENNQVQIDTAVESNQLPKIGEWTRIEISHEKVDGKYFLSLSVGGREVGRKHVVDPHLRKLTDVKVYLGGKECFQPGFIRRLVVLKNQ